MTTPVTSRRRIPTRANVVPNSGPEHQRCWNGNDFHDLLILDLHLNLNLKKFRWIKLMVYSLDKIYDLKELYNQNFPLLLRRGEILRTNL